MSCPRDMRDNADFTNRFFVITGGPGTGKTTLLNALKEEGFCCISEVAREIIREQAAKDGEALPWKNREKYTELMLVASIQSYRDARMTYELDETVFFDRGIPDTLCYAAMIGLRISAQMKLAADRCRYHSRVFLLPPWREIYHTDAERKQTWDEAVYTYEMMKKTYREYGYHPVEVPRTTVEERVRFVRTQSI